MNKHCFSKILTRCGILGPNCEETSFPTLGVVDKRGPPSAHVKCSPIFSGLHGDRFFKFWVDCKGFVCNNVSVLKMQVQWYHMALTIKSTMSFIFWISIDCSLHNANPYNWKEWDQSSVGRACLSIWEAKVFRRLQFYNCTCLETLLKPCRCTASSQSSEPLKDMHNKQSLKYVFIPGHMVLSGVSWIFGSVHCWKMGLQGPTSQSSCQKRYQKESAVAWLFAFCGC